MEEQLKQLHEAFNSFKTLNEQAIAEVKQYGKVSGDLDAKMTALSGKMDEIESKINAAQAENAKSAAMASRIDELEAKLARKGSFKLEGEEGKAELQFKKGVFFKALRAQLLPAVLESGRVLTADEFKALTVSSDPGGGYLAPKEYVMEILSDVLEYSPLRSIARIRTTSKQSVQIPKRTGRAAAAWVTESGTRTETTNPTYGMEEIRTHELYGMIKVSKQELEDSAFDLEAFIREELSEQFGVSEGTAFISGSGAGKPEGILTNASVAYTAGGDASLLTGDGLIAIYYDIKDAYLQNATWVMNRATLKSVRQLKETTTGQYLWAPGIKTDGRPATILDRPYLTCPDMPNVAGNAYPIAFGDFRRGYIVVDRIEMEMMNDPYSSKSTGMVEFSARRRVGGQVIMPEAIRKLKIATS